MKREPTAWLFNQATEGDRAARMIVANWPAWKFELSLMGWLADTATWDWPARG